MNQCIRGAPGLKFFSTFHCSEYQDQHVHHELEGPACSGPTYFSRPFVTTLLFSGRKRSPPLRLIFLSHFSSQLIFSSPFRSQCKCHFFREDFLPPKTCLQGQFLSVYYFLRFYLFIFRQRGREGERKGEKHHCVVASHAPPTGDLACNPVMCTDWGSNQQPFGSKAGTQSTKLNQPGLLIYLYQSINLSIYLPINHLSTYLSYMVIFNRSESLYLRVLISFVHLYLIESGFHHQTVNTMRTVVASGVAQLYVLST